MTQLLKDSELIPKVLQCVFQIIHNWGSENKSDQVGNKD